jgi:2-dehydro-3-deoxygluconokinase
MSTKVTMDHVACIGEGMIELTLPRGKMAMGRIGFAGDSLNTAVYLKRAGGAGVDVAYVTALGNDPLSDRMLEFFASEGLETGLVERREGRVPGLYAINVDAAGERSFTYWRDTSAARTLFIPPAKVMPERLGDFCLIYLSGISLAIMSEGARDALRRFLVHFRANGGLVAFDSNYRPRLWRDRKEAQQEIAAFWAITDIGLPSFDDEQALFGDADAAAVIQRLNGLGVVRGALKRGKAGPLPLAPLNTLPDFPPAARVVDTTAAGDSFNGAYLAALLRGAPEAERLAAGHAMASEVIAHPGAIIARVPSTTI